MIPATLSSRVHRTQKNILPIKIATYTAHTGGFLLEVRTVLGGIDRIIVENITTGEVLAVITDDEVTTASNEIVVRMRPIYKDSLFDKKANNEHYKSSNNSSNYRHAPIMRSVLSLLTNPAFFFGCLSGGLLARLILGPIVFR